MGCTAPMKRSGVVAGKQHLSPPAPKPKTHPSDGVGKPEHLPATVALLLVHHSWRFRLAGWLRRQESIRVQVRQGASKGVLGGISGQATDPSCSSLDRKSV